MLSRSSYVKSKLKITLFLLGVVDVLSLELIQYGGSKDKNVSKVELTEKTHPKLFEEASQARVRVIERLSDCNDELANKVISSESFDGISTIDIVKALQKVTQERVSHFYLIIYVLCSII